MNPPSDPPRYDPSQGRPQEFGHGDRPQQQPSPSYPPPGANYPPMAGQQPPQQHAQNQLPHDQAPPQQQAFPPHQQSTSQQHAPAHHHVKDDSIGEALSDIHFTKFATPKLLSITYVVTLGLVGLLTIGSILVIAGSDASTIGKLFAIALDLFVAFLLVLLSRMYLETLAVFQRQRQLLEQISHKLDR